MTVSKEAKTRFIHDSIVENIIEAGRWAPSGDNTQPWRFEITADDSFTIHGNDTRDWVVYDLQGHASQLAIGCLHENLSIAASALGYRLEIKPDVQFDETNLVYHAALSELPAGETDEPLLASIWTRCVQRRPMGTRQLTMAEKTELEQSLPNGYSVHWLESAKTKKAVAKLMFGNAYTRLVMKEGFDVHSKIIDWGKSTSEDKIPDKSLGLDPLTLKLMKWTMGRWERLDFMTTYMAGTFMPRVLMDYLPSLKSSAHFIIVADKQPSDITDYISAGRAVQRFWLTSDRLGLGFQPEQTPVIFSEYLKRDVAFSTNSKALLNAKQMDASYRRLVGDDRVDRGVFMGRLGRTKPVKHRSIRLPLKKLIT